MVKDGKYSRKNLYIGAIFESNYCGKFKILNKTNFVVDQFGLHDVQDTTDPRYCIEFLNTGYVTSASRSAILSGRVKDKLLPEIANVGFIGADIKISDKKYIQFYRSWNDMINRCYNPCDFDYNMYGAIGVKVDPHWFSFWNYYNDMKYLKNFDQKMQYPNEYEIDKDFLQLNIPKENRIYSKETCMFISKFDNKQIMSREKSKNAGNAYFGVSTNIDRNNPNKIISYSANITIFNHPTGKYGIGRRHLANFKDPISAANLFNYVFPFITKDIPFHQINILNNVPQIPYNELKKNVSKNLPNNWFNDYPDWEYIASAMEAAGNRFTYIYW